MVISLHQSPCLSTFSYYWNNASSSHFMNTMVLINITLPTERRHSRTRWIKRYVQHMLLVVKLPHNVGHGRTCFSQSETLTLHLLNVISCSFFLSVSCAFFLSFLFQRTAKQSSQPSFTTS